jgi:hypothetical protein
MAHPTPLSRAFPSEVLGIILNRFGKMHLLEARDLQNLWKTGDSLLLSKIKNCLSSIHFYYPLLHAIPLTSLRPSGFMSQLHHLKSLKIQCLHHQVDQVDALLNCLNDLHEIHLEFLQLCEELQPNFLSRHPNLCRLTLINICDEQCQNYSLPYKSQDLPRSLTYLKTTLFLDQDGEEMAANLPANLKTFVWKSNGLQKARVPHPNLLINADNLPPNITKLKIDHWTLKIVQVRNLALKAHPIKDVSARDCVLDVETEMNWPGSLTRLNLSMESNQSLIWPSLTNMMALTDLTIQSNSPSYVSHTTLPKLVGMLPKNLTRFSMNSMVAIDWDRLILSKCEWPIYLKTLVLHLYSFSPLLDNDIGSGLINVMLNLPPLNDLSLSIVNLEDNEYYYPFNETFKWSNIPHSSLQFVRLHSTFFDFGVFTNLQSLTITLVNYHSFGPIILPSSLRSVSVYGKLQYFQHIRQPMRDSSKQVDFFSRFVEALPLTLEAFSFDLTPYIDMTKEPAKHNIMSAFSKLPRELRRLSLTIFITSCFDVGDMLPLLPSSHLKELFLNFRSIVEKNVLPVPWFDLLPKKLEHLKISPPTAGYEEKIFKHLPNLQSFSSDVH